MAEQRTHTRVIIEPLGTPDDKMGEMMQVKGETWNPSDKRWEPTFCMAMPVHCARGFFEFMNNTYQAGRK